MAGLTVEQMARIVMSEAQVLPYLAKIGVAQTIVDNNFNPNAFTQVISQTYTPDCLQAVKEVLNGQRRFPGYKLLQFRSAKYSDKNGNPDWAKLYAPPSNLPKDYLYLGKDSSEDGKYCHFYFGIKDTEQDNTLKLRVEYSGDDGINIRKTPDFGDNIVGVLKKSNAWYTVTELSPDKKFAHLKSGVWITANPQYVRIYEGEIVDYYVKVLIRDLNIRKGAGTNYVNYDEPIAPGVYHIVEEKTGLGASKWLLLKSYLENRNGWISADFCERV